MTPIGKNHVELFTAAEILNPCTEQYPCGDTSIDQHEPVCWECYTGHHEDPRDYVDNDDLPF